MQAVRWFRTVVTEHYSDFEGRAGLAEFWWYWVAFSVIDLALAVLESPMHTRIPTALFAIGLFPPTVGVWARRLHDIGKSGWWLLVGLVPLVGGILLVSWFARPGTSGPNEFGPEPKESARGT